MESTMGQLALDGSGRVHPETPSAAPAGIDAGTVRTFAPASGELLAELPVTSDDEVRRTVARARKAQGAWTILPVEERAERLLRLRDAIAERAEDLVQVVSRECGKPLHEALVHEVMTLVDLTAWTCRHAPQALAPERTPVHLMKHRASEVRYVPRGVVGVISPWNFPLVIPMGSVVSALAAGNACVVKPSEVTPLALLEAKKIYDSTGLPEDLFSVVVGYGPTGQALVDAGIDYCVFTGGVETGRRVAAACGQRLIPCTMELGGKAPLVACEDCDLELTARAIVFGGFANSGQACVSVERVYAHERVYPRLVERVGALARQLRQGDPSRGDVDLGAITFPHQIEVARRHVQDALGKGARLVCGGEASPGGGQNFAPTVLSECNHTMAVMRDEIFGPVVPMMPVASDAEAVRLANDSHLGLNAYVFTTSRDRAHWFAERIEAGSVVVNDVLSNYAMSEAPFGGIKQSGFGRVHGVEGLREMCNRKHVSWDRFASPPPPHWFPYTAKSYSWLRRGMKLVFGGGSLLQRVGDLF
jgi:succinate-semialdehyde dehydrogenase/glutarate-semialdehyde dehydrogenase